MTSHSVSEREAESVVRAAQPPYPRKIGREKHVVWGATPAGRYLQVIFVMRSARQVNYEWMSIEDIIELGEGDVPLTYVIHARDLTPTEKSQYRRST